MMCYEPSNGLLHFVVHLGHTKTEDIASDWSYVLNIPLSWISFNLPILCSYLGRQGPLKVN